MVLALTTFAVIALAAFGAITDIRERTIRNWLVVALAGAALIVSAVDSGTGMLSSQAIHAGLALVVGMLLFQFGWIGGGDAKFYAASALAVPLDRWLHLLGWTSLAGLVLVIFLVICRKILGRKVTQDLKTKKGIEVPFGVAIFAGLALTI